MEHIKERIFLHFRSIRMPFDDCRIPGDEMPRLSGVKPWVARDLITAVLLIAVVVLAAYFGESRSSRDDDGWEYNGRGDVYAGRSGYYRGY